MLTILGYLIIIGLLFWASTRLIAAFGIGEPVRTIIYVALVIVTVLLVAPLLGIPLPALR